MTALADTVLKLIELGATQEMIRAVIDGHEAAKSEVASLRTSRQDRNRRYYLKNKAELSSDEQDELRRLTSEQDALRRDEQKEGSPTPPKKNSSLPHAHPSDGHTPRGDSERRSRKPKSALAPAYSPEFEMWWAEYPRRKGVSKSEAFAVYDRLSEADREAAFTGAIALAEHCRAEQTPERFIPHPVVFLRQRRFECLDTAA